MRRVLERRNEIDSEHGDPNFAASLDPQLRVTRDTYNSTVFNSRASTLLNMKGPITVAAFGLSGLAAAAICNNNCGRQVAGTAAGKVPLETRRAMCSSFLATTTTVTPPVATQTPPVVYNRNVHNRAASSPTVTGEQPAYATMCANNVEYWSACQCFGISPTTITVTAPTPITTLAAPTCTQGVEYALWMFEEGSDKADELYVAYQNFPVLNRNSLVSGVPPAQSGVVARVGFPQWWDYGNPLRFDGVSGPAGSSMPYNVLEHRGYLVPSQAGAYAFQFSMVDDVAAVWIGEHAQSDISTRYSVLNGTLGDYNPPKRYAYNVAEADLGKPVPFRVFWGNGPGPAGHLWNIVDPSGAEILGYNTQKNRQIIASYLSDATEREPGSGTTAALARVLLSRLRSVQEKLPPDILSERAVQLYLSHAELTVREGLIGRNQVNARDSLSHFSRLQDLELLMDCAEKWLGLFTQMPLNDWVGINVDVFAQFTHTLVIVFKLNTLSETGWDLDEYRRRANVLQILDRTCETIDSVPSATGMVDADGPRSGLFFKTTYLLRAIKALFVTEMGPLASAGREKPQSTDGRDGPLDDDSVSILDDFLMNLENEPWISDILGPSWDSQLDSSVGFPFEAPSDTGEA
ncbi:Ca2+-modulated nonselective cation channel polycystin protein [Purpureocillium lavendulum]|uniref:Ca2+-modulated nonselective cation channel polycystin protein n=1 Tax=Purpureocillium lavendulum TaxID=1247861 RepID=A0AB34FRF0_9HYPO|nr:Ca2+-modulated nonselective cation channel polycystin protein [Purpureocillium lavendulum]